MKIAMEILYQYEVNKFLSGAHYCDVKKMAQLYIKTIAEDKDPNSGPVPAVQFMDSLAVAMTGGWSDGR